VVTNRRSIDVNRPEDIALVSRVLTGDDPETAIQPIAE